MFAASCMRALCCRLAVACAAVGWRARQGCLLDPFTSCADHKGHQALAMQGSCRQHPSWHAFCCGACPARARGMELLMQEVTATLHQLLATYVKGHCDLAPAAWSC
ncbi:hypothetical protein COO60DRAFT_1561433 [Scenedesmus sp. NREL 46B-D3]|nr:hypothetical protein COO60DRAFT_1561433 [Scenedesmus sp. NREL 46B-D3]